MRQLLIATICLSATSWAGSFSDELEVQTKAAAASSRAGKYKEASTELAKWLNADGKRKAEAEKKVYLIDGVTRLSEAYAARAELATKAPNDAKAARALLLDLLKPQSQAEMAAVSDPRVAELLQTLRKLDPKAKAFFSPRKVKVVITGGLEGPPATELAIAMVEQLRPLGFEASNTEGTETLALETGMGKDVSMAGTTLLGPSADKMISCELIVHAKWTAGGAEVLKAELGSRSGGYVDIPGSCVKAAVKSVASKAGARMVEAWNAQ